MTSPLDIHILYSRLSLRTHKSFKAPYTHLSMPTLELEMLINATAAATAKADAAMALAAQNAHDSQEAFFVFAGSLVFLMQAGFAMLEAGSVSRKSTMNILFKNMCDAGIGAMSFWLIGYAIAFGDGTNFAGASKWGLNHDAFTRISATVDGAVGEYSMWFFQFTFAATAATIVSGAVAERTALGAYLVYSVFITAVIYPIVVFWGWSGGFNSTWTANGFSQGMSDFAGSGIVHLVGGSAGLVGAIAVGPRKGRFTNPDPSAFKPHNVTLQALGTIMLWFGWYGFNCGSGSMAIAGKVATTTTIGAAACCLTGVLLSKVFGAEKIWDVGVGMNCILAGLVSITAGANVIEPWGAFMAGVIGAFVYLGASKLITFMKIDDPLDAFAVHGACGFWGLLVVGIFGTKSAFVFATGEDGGCLETGGCGAILAANASFGIAVVLWTVSTTGLVFGMLKLVGKLAPGCVGENFPTFAPEGGIDLVEHGGQAYIFDEEMGKKHEADVKKPASAAEIGISAAADVAPTVTAE